LFLSSMNMNTDIYRPQSAFPSSSFSLSSSTAPSCSLLLRSPRSPSAQATTANLHEAPGG
jgi:hypothetical protein